MGIIPYHLWYKLKNSLSSPSSDGEYKEGDKILLKSGRIGKILGINTDEKYKKYSKKYIVKLDDKNYDGKYDEFDAKDIVWKVG